MKRTNPDNLLARLETVARKILLDKNLMTVFEFHSAICRTPKTLKVDRKILDNTKTLLGLGRNYFSDDGLVARHSIENSHSERIRPTRQSTRP